MGQKILDLGCGCRGYGKHLQKIEGTIGLDIGRGMCDIQGDLCMHANYGQILNPLRARMVKFVLEHATKILSVSRYQKEKEISRITKKANVNVVPLPCDTKNSTQIEKKKSL